MSLYRRPDSPYWWMVMSAPDGRPVRKSTKIHWDAPSTAQRKDLRASAERIYRDEQAKLTLEKKGLGPKPSRTLNEQLDWYSDHVSKLKRGHERELEIIERFRQDLGTVQLVALTKDRVLEWRADRVEDVKASTVNRELDLLKHVLASAVPAYLESSPIARLKQLHVDEVEPAVLTRADELKLLQKLKPADRALVVVALDTLMRAGSLLRLEWKHDHGDYLSVLNPKAASGYKAPVSKRARQALNSLKRRGPYIFWHRRKARTDKSRSNSLKQMIEDGCRRAKVKYGRGRGITFHGLRHTGASRMAENGVDLKTIQRLGNWKSLRSLTRYLHTNEAAIRGAVEGVGEGVGFTWPARATKNGRKSA